MKFGFLFVVYLNSAILICQSTDISNCFRGFLRLRDNVSRLILLGEGAGCGVADGAFKLVTLNPNPLPMRGVESSKTTLSHQSFITDRSKMVLQLWF